MLKDLIKGINIGLGFILVIGILFGVVWAVGFHTADEILGGTFSGNYIFQNNLAIGIDETQFHKIHMHNNDSTYTTIQFTNMDTDYNNVSGGFRIGLLSNEHAGIYHGEPKSIIFGTNNVQRMQIDSVGNVAIGYLAPNSKLDVNGTIRADEICDETGNNCKDISTGWSTGGLIPVGSTMAYFTANCPTGWLKTDGSAISRITYSDLFNEIGVMYGSGDGTTTFNLPDTRGYFLRSTAEGSSMDPDRASRTNRGDGTTGDNVGTIQEDATAINSIKVQEAYYTAGAVSVLHGGGFYEYSSSPNFGKTWRDSSTDLNRLVGDLETRPRNINVLYCIKY